MADAFEAMTAARPYRMTPLTSEQALAELRKFAGVQFDPVVVDAFVRTNHVDGVPDAGRPSDAAADPAHRPGGEPDDGRADRRHRRRAGRTGLTGRPAAPLPRGQRTRHTRNP